MIAPKASPHDQRHRPQLLIVEDDEGLHWQLRWAYDGYEVIVAGDRAAPQWQLSPAANLKPAILLTTKRCHRAEARQH
jgi:hypothetical protein